MANDRFLSMLGLCRRASKISLGHDVAKQSLRDKQAYLCILTSDASERLLAEMQRLAENIPVIVVDYNMQDIGIAIGKKVGVMTINDEGFAKSIAELANKEV